MKTIAINTDKKPYCPHDGWSRARILNHTKNGKIVMDFNEIILYQCERQKINYGCYNRMLFAYDFYGSYIDIENKEQIFLNASVLDYLLTHQTLIPEKWKGSRRIFFWGTIFENCGIFVRYLRWTGDDWMVENCPIDSHSYYDGEDYAAVYVRK